MTTKKTHRDDAMNRRCNGCERLVRQCICDDLIIDGVRIERDKFVALAEQVEEEWQQYGRPMWEEMMRGVDLNE